MTKNISVIALSVCIPTAAIFGLSPGARNNVYKLNRALCSFMTFFQVSLLCFFFEQIDISVLKEFMPSVVINVRSYLSKCLAN